MKNHITITKKKVIHKLKTFIYDTSGGVVSILFLILLPLLLFMSISRTEQTRILRATNVTLENAIEESARQAAMMVDPESQAKGNPLIAYNRAIPMLEEYLKTYLGLDDNFTSNGTTSINHISYQAVIYNGATELTGYEYEDYFNDYYEDNQVAYLVEVSSDGGMNVIENTGETEFVPKTYYISDDYGITEYPTSNSIKVTMDKPGILLWVKAHINPVIIDSEKYQEVATRYAYAKIVKRK